MIRENPTATMIYDQLPIHDDFHRVDADTVLGAMGARGDAQTFLSILRREG